MTAARPMASLVFRARMAACVCCSLAPPRPTPPCILHSPAPSLPPTRPPTFCAAAHTHPPSLILASAGAMATVSPRPPPAPPARPQILAFPCNQFGEQEPGSMDEIVQFVHSHYQVGRLQVLLYLGLRVCWQGRAGARSSAEGQGRRAGRCRGAWRGLGAGALLRTVGRCPAWLWATEGSAKASSARMGGGR